MKRELLKYLSGLCQAASAALLAGAVIVPEMRTASLWLTAFLSLMGAGFVILGEKVGVK